MWIWRWKGSAIWNKEIKKKQSLTNTFTIQLFNFINSLSEIFHTDTTVRKKQKLSVTLITNDHKPQQGLKKLQLCQKAEVVLPHELQYEPCICTRHSSFFIKLFYSSKWLPPSERKANPGAAASRRAATVSSLGPMYWWFMDFQTLHPKLSGLGHWHQGGVSPILFWAQRAYAHRSRLSGNFQGNIVVVRTSKMCVWWGV